MTTDLNSPEPEVRIDAPSAFCSGVTPQLLKGLIRQYLGWHFGDPNNIRNHLLRHYVWRPGTATAMTGKDTRIVIDVMEKYNADQTDQRPAIFIKRQDLGAQFVGMGNNRHHGLQRIEGVEEYTGIDGTGFLVHCIGMDGGESDILGWEVYTAIRGFAPQLKRLPGMMRFRATDLSKVEKIEECRGHWGATIKIECAFQNTEVLTPHAPKIKHVEGVDGPSIDNCKYL